MILNIIRWLDRASTPGATGPRGLWSFVGPALVIVALVVAAAVHQGHSFDQIWHDPHILIDTVRDGWAGRLH